MTDQSDIRRLARLAGLTLTHGEVVVLAQDVAEIGHFLERVLSDEANPSGLGMSAAGETGCPDYPGLTDRRIDVALVAPEMEGDEIRVPPVLGEDT